MGLLVGLVKGGWGGVPEVDEILALFFAYEVGDVCNEGIEGEYLDLRHVDLVFWCVEIRRCGYIVFRVEYLLRLLSNWLLHNPELRRRAPLRWYKHCGQRTEDNQCSICRRLHDVDDLGATGTGLELLPSFAILASLK